MAGKPIKRCCRTCPSGRCKPDDHERRSRPRRGDPAGFKAGGGEGAMTSAGKRAGASPQLGLTPDRAATQSQSESPCAARTPAAAYPQCVLLGLPRRYNHHFTEARYQRQCYKQRQGYEPLDRSCDHVTNGFMLAHHGTGSACSGASRQVRTPVAGEGGRPAVRRPVLQLGGHTADGFAATSALHRVGDGRRLQPMASTAADSSHSLTVIR